MRLVTEEVLAAIDVPASPSDGIDPAALADPEAGPSLRAFLLLTHWPYFFMERVWSPEAVFWSRYYWFRRFVRLRSAASGPDAGLEQQAFQLLELPHPICNPDWSDLEPIEKLAEEHAGRKGSGAESSL